MTLMYAHTSCLRGKRSGLTLIEIMIVIGIISLVASLVITRYTHVQRTADIGSIATELHVVAGALDQYQHDTGAYPGSNQGVGPALFGGAGNTYFNATPVTPDSASYLYALEPPPYAYIVCANEGFDGSELQGFKSYGSGGAATPVTGTQYTLCTIPQLGVFAYGG